MRLKECLETQTQAHLREIARTAGLGVSAYLHANLPERLAERLTDRDVLLSLIRRLSEPERAALKVITFAGGGSGIVMEQCHQRINQVTGQRRRNGAQVVGALMGRGLVYVGRARYRQHYFVPADLQVQLAGMFARELLERVAVDSGASVAEQVHDSYALLRWTCQFLAYVRKAPVELTQAGIIYRRAQRHLLRLMGLEPAGGENGDASPASSGGQAGAGHGGPGGAGAAAHPEPLDLIFDYCRARRLCEVRGLTLGATGQAEEWMSLPVWERRGDYLAFWREARVSGDVDVQAVLSVLLSLPEDTWVDMHALFQELEPMASDLHRGSLRRRLEQKVLRQLLVQGVLVLGETGGTRVCRMTDLGRALLGGGGPAGDVETEHSFFVQPNFEILVPSRIETGLLWRLEECADLEKPDWMMVYRISRATVYRALKLGRRPEEVVELLDDHARNQLPQNVAFSMRDWSAAFGRLWFGEAFILQCDSEALADELLASRSVGQYIRGRLSPTALLIDREQHAAVLALLEEEGYMPAPGVRELAKG